MDWFVIALAAAAVCALVWFFGTPKGKGMLGEWRVRAVIGKTRAGERYVINDIIINVDGKTAQIDHIVINKNGVYVIETKNYSGRIYGSDDRKYWTQTLAGGRVKNSFYSPVRQNLVHVAKLRELLGERVFLTPVVVFVQNNTKYIISSCVAPISALKKRLQLPQKKKPYTPDEMSEIYGLITSLKGDVSKSEHTGQIRERQRLINSNICPVCKRPLVKRSGEYGEFYGCRGYPNCTFTKK